MPKINDAAKEAIIDLLNRNLDMDCPPEKEGPDFDCTTEKSCRSCYASSILSLKGKGWRITVVSDWNHKGALNTIRSILVNPRPKRAV